MGLDHIVGRIAGFMGWSAASRVGAMAANRVAKGISGAAVGYNVAKGGGFLHSLGRGAAMGYRGMGGATTLRGFARGAMNWGSAAEFAGRGAYRAGAIAARGATVGALGYGAYKVAGAAMRAPGRAYNWAFN